MDLSICIPLFNTDVNTLVKELWDQGKKEKIGFEILLYDDGSQEEYKALNRGLGTLDNVNYTELPENIGRSAIRNKLATEARGKQLLFLDDDSKIITKQFLANYLKPHTEKVICGGRIYPLFDGDDSKKLHWLYGTYRETRPAAERKKQSWNNFHSNNFLIDKNTFLKVKFNEKLRHYGHEDTFFGLMLKQYKIDVKHIENPVCHMGLEESKSFLSKTKQALDNLLLLRDIDSEMAEKIKALKYLQRTRKMGIHKFIARRFRNKKEAWEHNLYSSKPSLRVLSLYKLGYLCHKASNTNH